MGWSLGYWGGVLCGVCLGLWWLCAPSCDRSSRRHSSGRHATWIEVCLGVSAKEEYIWVLQICSFRRPLRSRFDYKPVDLVSPDGGVEGALVAKDVTGKREATTTSFLELSFMLMEPGRSSPFF